MPDGTNNSSVDVVPEPDYFQSAGALRVFLKRGTDLVMRGKIWQKLKKMPRKVKVKAKSVSTLSDRVGQVWDVVTHFGESHKHTKKIRRESIFVHSTKVFLRALPTFVTNAAMGTALFAAYEVTMSHLWNQKQLDMQEATSFRASAHCLKLGVASATSGLIAGWTHGSLQILWKTVTHQRIPNAIRASGIFLSHGISHATLFSTYEVLKEALLWSLHSHELNFAGVFAIAVAGGLSGTAQEFINHYVDPLEQLHSTKKKEAFKEVLKVVKHQRQETVGFRHFFSPSVMLPSAIGFLAFEYGKEVLQNLDEE
eukprot:TRINITY_DN9385_c0_g1_i1.p1 TRINITY_DN9385_c0_g1~~TRINITY_DN9385_c0_g1_i1.p1  ORF type:complete len:348 (-),score=38.46 TRINITY_DN9385_c0_g1_i1:115-1047(-)